MKPGIEYHNVYSCPAFDCMQPDVKVPHLVADERIAVFQDSSYRGSPKLASVNSVVSYLLKNGLDPIAGIDKARQNRENLHWINLECITLSAEPQARREYTALYVGQEVEFEGIRFSIERAPNGNFELESLE